MPALGNYPDEEISHLQPKMDIPGQNPIKREKRCSDAHSVSDDGVERGSYGKDAKTLRSYRHQPHLNTLRLPLAIMWRNEFHI